MGAALVGLVPLELSDLGLSHLTGPGPNQRKNSNTELLALREVRQAERCSVAFFFSLECDGDEKGKLEKVLEVNIYGFFFSLSSERS